MGESSVFCSVTVYVQILMLMSMINTSMNMNFSLHFLAYEGVQRRSQVCCCSKAEVPEGLPCTLWQSFSTTSREFRVTPDSSN